MLRKLLLVLLFPLGMVAQKHHEIGVFGGTASYKGDLQSDWFPNNGYRPCGGLMYKHFINPNFGFRFGAMYATLYGADSNSTIPAIKSRNLNFQTNLFELHGGFEANLLPVDIDDYKVSPYIFAGISVFKFNPYTTSITQDKIYLKPLSTEGQGLPQYTDRKVYSLVNVGIPLGAGFKVFCGKKVMLSAEIGFRYTATDYLDDVSKTYVNLDTLFAYKGKQSVDLSFRTDELKEWDKNYPAEKFKRGDDVRQDWYWFAGVGVSIYFDAFGNLWPYKQTKCPTKVFGR